MTNLKTVFYRKDKRAIAIIVLCTLVAVRFVFAPFRAIRNAVLITICLFLIAKPLQSQQNPWTDYAIPAALTTIGFISVYNTALCDLKSDINRNLSDFRGSNYLYFDDYLQFLPVSYFVLGDYVGTPSRHNFNERFLLASTATLIATAAVCGLKYTITENRPDRQYSTHIKGRNSFPSGHTATAFMGATLIWHSYGLGAGIAAYAVATGIGFMRLYNERHWLNDVVAGAGIGILSANLAYLLLPWEKSWFKHKKSQKTEISLLPYCGRQCDAGIALSVRF